MAELGREEGEQREEVRSLFHWFVPQTVAMGEMSQAGARARSFILVSPLHVRGSGIATFHCFPVASSARRGITSRYLDTPHASLEGRSFTPPAIMPSEGVLTQFR